jgi:PAS domain S-box-containing protein
MINTQLDYKELIETMADMIIITDEDGIITYVSPQWKDVLGYTSDEMLGKRRWDFMSVSEAEKLQEKFFPYFEKRLSFYMLTHAMTHKNGQRIFIESSGTPIFSSAGEFEGYRVSNRDITNRSLSEDYQTQMREYAYAKLLKYQEVITDISKSFMDSPFDQLDKAINKSLADLGNLLKVCRVYVFEFSEITQTMSNTFEWCYEGVEPAIDMLQDLSVDIFPWWMKKLHLNEVINIYNVNEMGEEQASEKQILQDQDILSVLVVPMHVNQKLIGFIGFDVLYKNKRFQDEIHLIRMYSEIVGYALAKQKDEHRIRESMKQVKETFHQTVEAFSSFLEISDPYTSGHQIRVAQLAVAIAKQLNFSEYQIEALYMASMLHDLGKLYIPLQILNKPGKLTDAEFELVKTHSELGYSVLKKISFPWPIADMVLQHHERLDGRGYPNGLKGDEIMLEAQIIGVADSIEAMSSHRPYRPSLGMGYALEEIKRLKGLIYREDVVDACVSIIENGKFHFD